MTRILIVDDNTDLAENLAEILESEGATVVVHQGGEEAVEWARAHGFDRALVDMRMPGMDGATLVRQLHALRPEAEYMVMTAYAAEERERAAIAAGASCILRKPFRVGDVLAWVA